ncbi:BREX system serine/threonine kinase PglW [Streptomyces sp. NPDC006704]|uniref:BREX system serine/threonine kinase PglW n=1 Tax=Streptomyces sp. NPDC006704 TaxID=3364760 RepID=UPI0036B78496
MRADSPRWHEVSKSEFPHERAGLALVRELLPDRPPFQAWSNFEFRDRQGKWHEVDLLVLGESRLHLVELKHYRGAISGNAYTWQRNNRSEDSPLPSARRKAQRLASVVKDALRELAPQLGSRDIPFIQESIFLHAPDSRCQLPPGDRTDLFGLDGQQSRSGLPSIAERLLEPLGARRRPGLIDHDDLLPALFERIGFAQRREHVVGSWRLTGQPEAEGVDWQEWPAEHRIARDRARIRFMVTPPGSSDAQRQASRQLVEREYGLTRRLQHDGLLLPRDLVEDEIGVGLVFPDDREAQRLDLWLDDQQGSASLNAQVSVIRQLAEVLAYAHRNHVVHRGLTPAAVQVRSADTDVKVRLGGWQVAGRDDPANATRPSHGASTRIMRALEEEGSSDDPERRHAEAYLAPEGRWDPTADRIRLDVFALGAVAYHLVAGQPPATDGADLRERLNRDGGLDLTVDIPEVPGTLRRLVLEATRPAVTRRLRDMQAFLALLDDVDREVSSPGAGADGDPLEAAPGTLIGQRFELLRRLGSGSTAVGLLVKDRENGDERRVLKVARDDSAARRLVDEAEVLLTLRPKAHPRIVRLSDEQILRVGRRTALLLESAGDETLADALRERTRLSLDLLDRWGTDVLEALVGLDKAGVDHRDIKPANLGIREQRSDRAKHLVLFDFSLSRAGAASIEAGTPPYLDPFLGTALRPNWDSAAERYAAAVTLYEMATGRAPVYGDGLSDPSVLRDEVTLEPGAFDPSLTDQLTDFFRTALSRDSRQRHHTAAEMHAAWRAVFTGTDTAPPEDADERAAAATPTMSLSEAGLSARALSAVEPLGLATVADLALADPGKLSRLAGVADVSRREVRSRAKQWRERFAAELAATTQPSAAVKHLDDPLSDPSETAEVLVQAAGSPRATGRRRAARILLGLAPGADAFATRAEFATACGLSGAPQASNALSAVQDSWADNPSARRRLDDVLSRATEALASLGGIATADDVVAVLAASAGTAESEPLESQAARRRIVVGLLVAALDRAELVERGGGDSSPVTRRRRRGGRSILLTTAPVLLDAADTLGSIADELVADATATGDHVVPVGRAAARLRPAWPQSVTAPDDTRLAKIAARLSTRAHASRRGELHDRDLDAAVAIRIALGGLAPSQKLTVDDVKRRVRARFPELAALPNRPRLDQVITEAKLPLSWDGEAFAIPSRRSDGTSLASRTMFAPRGIPLGRSSDGAATREDAQLRQSASSRSFLALGAPAGGQDAVAEALVARHGAISLDLSAVLLEALRTRANAAGIPWELVKAADAAAPGTRDMQGLSALVQQAAPAVEEAITAAIASAPGSTRPVLLVEAAPLARYGHLDIVARLADITTSRAQAVWLLLPLGSDRAPLIDRVPVPLTHGGQFLCLDDWLRALTPKGESA